VKFTDWMQHHRRSILFLIAILAAGGLAVSFNLPVALFPRIDFPRVVVGVDAGDRPADLMAIEVTRPIEETIRSVPGVRKVRSNTSRGSADISIDFDWGDDMVAAMLQVESAVNQVLPNLPSGVSFTVRRMDPTVFPVLAYSLTSDTHTLTDLRDIAQYQLLPLLSTVNGVARVEVQVPSKSMKSWLIPAVLNRWDFPLKMWPMPFPPPMSSAPWGEWKIITSFT